MRTLRETSENRLNEITYLETKLGKANDQIVQLQEQNKRSLEDNEKTNLIREIVALRFIVADLIHAGGSQDPYAKDTVDIDNKENSVGKGNASTVGGVGDDALRPSTTRSRPCPQTPKMSCQNFATVATFTKLHATATKTSFWRHCSPTSPSKTSFSTLSTQRL